MAEEAHAPNPGSEARPPQPRADAASASAAEAASSPTIAPAATSQPAPKVQVEPSLRLSSLAPLLCAAEVRSEILSRLRAVLKVSGEGGKGAAHGSEELECAAILGSHSSGGAHEGHAGGARLLCWSLSAVCSAQATPCATTALRAKNSANDAGGQGAPRGSAGLPGPVSDQAQSQEACWHSRRCQEGLGTPAGVVRPAHALSTLKIL